MRILTSTLLALVVACGGKSTPAPSTPPPSETVAVAKLLVNVDDEGVGVSGFDPMGYRTDAKAVPGSAEQATQFGGATYWFASAESKAAFVASPEQHAPRYGGYCAYAMSQGRLSPVQPEVFEIVDGQLLLFTNPEFKRLFDADPAAIKAKADVQWPAMVKQHGK